MFRQSPVPAPDGPAMTGPAAASRFLAVGLTTTALTHLGYPVVIRLAARRRLRTAPVLPTPADAELPSVTVVVPAYEEARFISNKLQDVLAQDYPADRLEIVVVDDGSQDGTAELAERATRRARVVRHTERRGKTQALNTGVAVARGDVVVFTDANGSLLAGSLRNVVAPFAEPRVAVVGGTKRPVGTGVHGAGESTYWKLENGLRSAESAFGAVVGVDGGIYAVRRSAFRPIPEGVYADDYWISLDALRRGLHVVHVSEASAIESVGAGKRGDFERRTRIAAGIWKESLAHLDLLDPRRKWVALAFLFHRVLRTGAVPALLPALVPAAVLAGRRSRSARLLAWGQAFCWVAAGAGALSSAPSLAVPYQFAVTNMAALRGGGRQFRRRQSSLWKRTERGPWR